MVRLSAWEMAATIHAEEWAAGFEVLALFAVKAEDAFALSALGRRLRNELWLRRLRVRRWSLLMGGPGTTFGLSWWRPVFDTVVVGVVTRKIFETAFAKEVVAGFVAFGFGLEERGPRAASLLSGRARFPSCRKGRLGWARGQFSAFGIDKWS